MHARILADAPESGSIPEVAFARSGPPVMWVEFTNDGGARWAGVFDVGDPGLPQRVVPFATDSAAALVIARGRGYVVDVAERTLRYAVARPVVLDAVPVPGKDYVLACDFRHVRAYASHGDGHPLWERYVALDGMNLREATAEALTGYVEEDLWENDSPVTVWREFTLRLADRQVSYGEIVPEKVARAREAGMR